MDVLLGRAEEVQKELPEALPLQELKELTFDASRRVRLANNKLEKCRLHEEKIAKGRRELEEREKAVTLREQKVERLFRAIKARAEGGLEFNQDVLQQLEVEFLMDGPAPAAAPATPTAPAPKRSAAAAKAASAPKRRRVQGRKVQPAEPAITPGATSSGTKNLPSTPRR